MANPRCSFWFFGAAVMGVVLLSVPALAQRDFRYTSSLEADVNAHTTVVRGTIVGWDRNQLLATIKILEVIRSASPSPLPLQIVVRANEPEASELWRTQAEEGLFFLKPISEDPPPFRNPASPPSDLRLAFSIPTAPDARLPGEMFTRGPHFNFEGRLLRTREELLKAARDAARVLPSGFVAPDGKYLLFPGSDAYAQPARKWLETPLDSRLRARLIEWAASADWQARQSAAWALRYYVHTIPEGRDSAIDPEIRTLLHRLAADPYAKTPVVHAWASEGYPVREAVQLTFCSTDLNSESPEFTLINPTSLFQPVRLTSPIVLGLLVLVTGVLAVLIWRRRGRVISPAAVLLVLVAVALFVQAYRTRRTTEELVWTTDSACHAMASRDGGLEYQRLADWTEATRAPVLWASFDSPELPDVLWRPVDGSGFDFAGLRLNRGHVGMPRSPNGVDLHSAFRLRVPYWVMSAFFGVMALLITRSRVRTLRRGAAGFCRECGYDLRATPSASGPRLGQCPECGTLPEVKVLEGSSVVRR